MNTSRNYLISTFIAAAAITVTLVLSISACRWTMVSGEKTHSPKADGIALTPEPVKELGGHEHHWKIREEISDAFANVMAASRAEIIE